MLMQLMEHTPSKQSVARSIRAGRAILHLRLSHHPENADAHKKSGLAKQTAKPAPMEEKQGQQRNRN